MNKKTLIEVGEEEIERRVQLNKLSLNELTVQDETRLGQYVMAIIGKIRVANVGFEKYVFARVTFNNWASFKDYSGSYIESSPDGSHDVFAFGFTRRDKRPVNVEFALSGTLDGKEYWENNGGKNYCFHLSEDPLNDPTSGESEPGVVATWRVAEASSPDKQEEIVFDTSNYPHFEAHPLTPTKLYYSTLNRAPEEEVVAAKAPDNKHIRAFNALAMEDLYQTKETAPSNPENNPEDGVIEASTATFAEAGVCMTGEETQDGIEMQAEEHVEDQLPVEEPIEPVKFTKPADDESPDDVFDKLEKQKEGIHVELQIIEEPGDGAKIEGESNDAGQTAIDSAGQQPSQEGSQQKANAADTGKKKDKKQTKEEKKKKKEEKKDKKGDKKEKKKSKKGKAPPVPENQQNEDQKADSEKSGHKNGKEQNPSEQQKEGDQSSVSSKREKIGDEDSPKKPKKGFLNKMACCGKAEPD